MNATITFTVTHFCGHERTLEARPREARQTQKWMKQVKCPTCAAPEQAYWTLRYYNASGFGVEQEWTNVYAANAAEAKDFAITNYRIAQGNTYRVYAFKQEGRI